MAIVGFIVLVLVGLWLIFQGVMGMVVMGGLSGKMPWGMLIFVALGGGAIWLAVANSPFHLTMAGG